MVTPSALAVIIGIIGALLGVYFRESLRRAYRQKLIAIKLEAQINDLFRELVKSNFAEVLAFASVWMEERATALQTKGSAGFMEVERKNEDKLHEIKKKVEVGDADVDKDIEKSYTMYREMPQSLFDYHKEQFELVRESLFLGRGLLTEEEAAELSWDTAARVSALRTHATKLIHYFIALSLTLREMKSLDISAARSLLCSIIEEMVCFSLEIEPLRKKAERLRKTSVLSLAIEGMVRGS